MAASDDIKKIISRVSKALNRAVTKSELSKLGNLAIAIIQRRTRRGFGVKKSEGQRRKLKSLSRNYVAQRRKQRARLSRFTSPSKSNLTFTGQMLSSMKATVKKPGSVTISFEGRRRDGKRNRDIARFVSEARPFNNMSKSEVRVLVEDFDKTMQAQIDKALRGT